MSKFVSACDRSLAQDYDVAQYALTLDASACNIDGAVFRNHVKRRVLKELENPMSLMRKMLVQQGSKVRYGYDGRPASEVCHNLVSGSTQARDSFFANKSYRPERAVSIFLDPGKPRVDVLVSHAFADGFRAVQLMLRMFFLNRLPHRLPRANKKALVKSSLKLRGLNIDSGSLRRLPYRTSDGQVRHFTASVSELKDIKNAYRVPFVAAFGGRLLHALFHAQPNCQFLVVGTIVAFQNKPNEHNAFGVIVTTINRHHNRSTLIKQFGQKVQQGRGMAPLSCFMGRKKNVFTNYNQKIDVLLSCLPGTTDPLKMPGSDPLENATIQGIMPFASNPVWVFTQSYGNTLHASVHFRTPDLNPDTVVQHF